ncbi:MAG: ATP-binding protein [Solirubrobacterales bacterium]
MSDAATLERHPHARAVVGPVLEGRSEPSHAYLFHGPPGSGKAQAARELAATLLAEGAADPQAVRERVGREAHPDLTWVRPSGAHGIRIDDIEEPVVSAASRTPFEARRRVFVIEGADLLGDEAANRMLKTLEEPASFAHLVLLTSRPESVMATIRSRCLAVRFDTPAEEEVAAALVARSVLPETAQACARLSFGDSQRAMALATGEGPAMREAAEGFARAALEGQFASAPWDALLEPAAARGRRAAQEAEQAAAEEAQMLPEKERKRAEREAEKAVKRVARRERTAALDEAMRLAGLWFRDLACVAEDAAPLADATDRLDALGADAAGRDPAKLREAVTLVDEARSSLSLNPDEALQLQALAYRLARALA